MAVAADASERAESDRPRPARRRGGHARREQRLLGIAFVLPALAIYGAFMLYPFVASFAYSLTRWDGLGPRHWVGLDNYSRLIHDDRFWNAFEHTMAWVVVGTIAPLVIGFVLAVLLWSGRRFVLVLRTVYFLPFVLPSVVAATLWGWIYNPIFGPLNEALHRVGLGSLAHGWLGEPRTALGAVLISAIWATFGLVVVIFYAALQHISPDLIHAAELDGANWYQRARHVMVPGIAPVITMVTAITLIGGFSVFDVVYIMTRGGPGTSSDVLATYTYSQAFQQSDIGYGAALSMVITFVSLVTALVFVRLRERSARNV